MIDLITRFKKIADVTKIRNALDSPFDFLNLYSGSQLNNE